MDSTLAIDHILLSREIPIPRITAVRQNQMTTFLPWNKGGHHYPNNKKSS